MSYQLVYTYMMAKKIILFVKFRYIVCLTT